MNTYYGIKIGMSQAWDKSGKRLSVTKIKANPLTVTQAKTTDQDGYTAVQVAIGNKNSKLNQPLSKHLSKSKINKHPRWLREIRIKDQNEFQIGKQITPDEIFQVGDIINISSLSKGRGFAGVVKRWGFAGGPRTHGQSDRLRAPGSIGQGTDPGRVHKGKKMPGRYGTDTITVKNLQIIHIDLETNQIWVSGSVPGASNSLVKITKIRTKDFIGLQNITTESKDQQESEVKKEEDNTKDDTNTGTKESVADSQDEKNKTNKTEEKKDNKDSNNKEK